MLFVILVFAGSMILDPAGSRNLWDPTSITNCSLCILGKCPKVEVEELKTISSLPARSRLSMEDVGENQGLHAIWKNKRINRRSYWDASPEVEGTIFPKQTQFGFYGPQEFAKYYANKYVAKYDKVDTTEKPTGKQHNAFFIKWTDAIVYITTKTPTRGKFYHEVYWPQGHRILFTPFPMDNSYDPSFASRDYRQVVKNDPNEKTVKRGLYNETYYCNSQCNQVFIDWGPVCGARLKTELGQWNYEFKSFADYCDLQNFNCAYRFWCFIVAMRGMCPYTFLSNNDAHWDHNFLAGDVFDIRQNANYKVPYLDNVEKFAKSWFPGVYSKFSDNTAGFAGSNITWWIDH